MNHKTLTLRITKAGRKKIASLIANKTSASVKIAFGDGYKEFNEEDTTLEHERIQTNTKVSIISDNTVHVQAYLNDDKTEFDIHEIALLLQDENNDSTLIGIYRTNEILAKKTTYVDLLLDLTVEISGYNPKDFIIDLPTYQPTLVMPPASDKKFGAVRLATVDVIQTEKSDEFVLSTKNLATAETIKQKKSGFILTTNHLNMLVKSEATWTQLIEDQLLHEAKHELSPRFIGAIYHPYQKSIYSIYGIYDASEKSYILCGEYNENKSQTSIKIKTFSNSAIGKFAFSNSCPIFTLSEKNIDFYFLIEIAEESNQNLYKASFATDSTALELSKPYKILNKSTLFIYDNKIGAIGEKTIRFRSLKTLTLFDDVNLTRSRPASLVHIIQNKIYCFTDSDITIFTLRNSKDSPEVFTQISNSNIDLNTKDYVSTALGNYIYFFKITNYCKDTKDSADFYRYNILDNQWQSFTSPSAKLLNFTPIQSTAITAGNDIYLFFIGTQAGKKELKISILKCTP